MPVCPCLFVPDRVPERVCLPVCVPVRVYMSVSVFVYMLLATSMRVCAPSVLDCACLCACVSVRLRAFLYVCLCVCVCKGTPKLTPEELDSFRVRPGALNWSLFFNTATASPTATAATTTTTTTATAIATATTTTTATSTVTATTGSPCTGGAVGAVSAGGGHWELTQDHTGTTHAGSECVAAALLGTPGTKHILEAWGGGGDFVVDSSIFTNNGGFCSVCVCVCVCACAGGKGLHNPEIYGYYYKPFCMLSLTQGPGGCVGGVRDDYAHWSRMGWKASGGKPMFVKTGAPGNNPQELHMFFDDCLQSRSAPGDGCVAVYQTPMGAEEPTDTGTLAATGDAVYVSHCKRSPHALLRSAAALASPCTQQLLPHRARTCVATSAAVFMCTYHLECRVYTPPHTTLHLL